MIMIMIIIIIIIISSSSSSSMISRLAGMLGIIMMFGITV